MILAMVVKMIVLILVAIGAAVVLGLARRMAAAVRLSQAPFDSGDGEGYLAGNEIRTATG